MIFYHTNNNMRRRIAIIISAAFVFVASGCGDSNSKSKNYSTHSNTTTFAQTSVTTETTTSEVKKTTFTKNYEVDGIEFSLPNDVADWTNSDYVDLEPNQIKLYRGDSLAMGIAYYSNMNNIVNDIEKEIKQAGNSRDYRKDSIDGVNIIILYPKESGGWSNISFNYSKGAYIISIKNTSSIGDKIIIDEFVDSLHFK